MLAFLVGNRFVVPEIDKGSADFEPTSLPAGFEALPNGQGQAPDLQTLGVIYAEDYQGAGNWTVAEYMAIFPVSGQSPPPLASDHRHPPAFWVRVRGTSTKFANLQDFQEAVQAFRQEVGVAVACVEALGKRYFELQTSGFPNANQGVETRDLYAPSGAVVGCAFLARTGDTTTTQHWVLFNNIPFDNIKAVKRAESYTSVQAFLDAMQALRNNSPVAFRHAYEEATHYTDVPW